MSKRFLVTEVSTCPACGGSGEVKNPLLKKLDRWQKPQSFFYEVHHTTPSEIERPVTCGKCGGGGEVRAEVGLAQALGEILNQAEEAPW